MWEWKTMPWDWKVTTAILCIYGFLKEFRPSEPYLYEYEHVTLNISEHTLNSDVYPIWTYSYLLALIPTFILTDLFLYKPIIMFEAFSYIIVWILFVFFSSVFVQQMIELFYGWATATEIAYSAYIYVKVSRSKYKQVTSYTQAALQVGRFAAYVVGQLVILLKWGTYRTLNWISLISLLISFVFASSLPMVSWREAYRKKLDVRDSKLTQEEFDASTYKDFAKLHFKSIYSDFKSIYGDLFVAKWSLWWALASCGLYQITNYAQTLWGTVVDVKNSNLYNGFTEAACPLISIPVVMLMQRLNVDWPRFGELCLMICSLFDGAVLMLMALTPNLFVMYACYIAYRVVYVGMITIAQFNIAERLGSYTFGLVFGFNTFVALLLQTILTVIVCTDFGFNLSVRPQFIVYASYHFAVAVIFLIPIVIALVRRIVRWFRNEDAEMMTVHIVE